MDILLFFRFLQIFRRKIISLIPRYRLKITAYLFWSSLRTCELFQVVLWAKNAVPSRTWITVIIFTVQVESRECDSEPSSSNMISFDLSNSSNVPAGSVDDDEYVEYSLDMLADFPNNVEEEERVKLTIVPQLWPFRISKSKLFHEITTLKCLWFTHANKPQSLDITTHALV